MWCKAKFSASLLQSSVSHDSSEIILICWFADSETFLIIVSVENSCAASYFVTFDQFYIYIQDIDEFVSSSEQIWRNVALHHLLTNGSSAVNGCRQNETPNSW